MKYTLNFILKLKHDGSSIIYDPKAFLEQPLAISVSEIIEMVQRFTQEFEEVGIVEDNAVEPNASKATNDEKKSVQTSSKSSIALKGLSGRTYIRQSKKLDDEVLKQLCADIAEYLKTQCEKLTGENLLSPEIGILFSGIIEATEVRNYLSQYTRSSKKNFQNGYLYIMPL